MIFDKDLSNVNEEDLKLLISDQHPEGQYLEFKQEPPAKNDEKSWNEGSKLKPYGRDKLLSEIIAFANSQGGTLIVGIRETQDKPYRAEKITPVKRIAEFEEAFRRQIRDTIEPPIPIVNIVSIDIGSDGEGVLLVRVEKSRLAPHRNKNTKEAYFRRDESSEPMTMYEIQDLTLSIDRGLQKVKEIERDLFDEFCAEPWQSQDRYIGFNISLIPLAAELSLKDVLNVEGLIPGNYDVGFKVDGGTISRMRLPVSGHTSRPRVRGATYESSSLTMYHKQQLFCSGVVSFYVYVVNNRGDDSYPMFANWILPVVANALCIAHNFRAKCGAHNVEYGAFAQIKCEREVSLRPIVGGYFLDDNPKFIQGVYKFSELRVGPAKNFATLLREVERDYWHSAGFDGALQEYDMSNIFRSYGIEAL